LLGLHEGDNPQPVVLALRRCSEIVNQVVADYKRLDPKDSAYFDAQKTIFMTKDLASYTGLVAAIERATQTSRSGYSESIFQPMGAALGLKLMTP